MLTQTRSVLNLKETKRGVYALFSYSDDGWLRFTEVRMDWDVWDHMGRPKVITNSIEPGDVLNVDTPPEHRIVRADKKK